MFRKDPREREEQARKAREEAELYLAPTELKLLGNFTRVPGCEGELVELFTDARWLVRSAQGRRAHRLPMTFLLAVSRDDKVHFLKYRTRHKEVEIRNVFLVLDRHAVSFRVDHEDLYLDVTEGNYTTPIHIEREGLDPGAVEVLDALSE